MNKKLYTKTMRGTRRVDVRVQYGALCYRIDDGKVQVLLITSRRTGRWILPKGWPMADRDGAGTARQEAWEEAGVVGACSRKNIGLYFYDKVMEEGDDIPCVVEVYPIRVRRLAGSFPERSQRRRKWFSPKKAANLVWEPELKQLLRKIDPKLLR